VPIEKFHLAPFFLAYFYFMKITWTKTPRWVKLLFNNLVWDLPNTHQKVYLTFDDGPIPVVTEWVLDLLKSENVKATFFCIGANIQKHPEIYQRILTEGHQIGNHTFNHLNGWKTPTKEYLYNIQICENEMERMANNSKKLFRPPFGKITLNQSKALQNLGYKIIMWDVVSYDYNRAVTPEECLKNVVVKSAQGSIIVFHDSLKAEKNLKYALPKAIHFLKNNGFNFDVLS
jgi:peptidoglycan/xylan/chitin deacetylase (PgdA/CDA1 family)